MLLSFASLTVSKHRCFLRFCAAPSRLVYLHAFIIVLSYQFRNDFLILIKMVVKVSKPHLRTAVDLRCNSFWSWIADVSDSELVPHGNWVVSVFLYALEGLLKLFAKRSFLRNELKWGLCVHFLHVYPCSLRWAVYWRRAIVLKGLRLFHVIRYRIHELGVERLPLKTCLEVE